MILYCCCKIADQIICLKKLSDLTNSRNISKMGTIKTEENGYDIFTSFVIELITLISIFFIKEAFFDHVLQSV